MFVGIIDIFESQMTFTLTNLQRSSLNNEWRQQTGNQQQVRLQLTSVASVIASVVIKR